MMNDAQLQFEAAQKRCDESLAQLGAVLTELGVGIRLQSHLMLQQAIELAILKAEAEL